MHRQRGMSLIELMIAMALGMGVALASLALLNAARASYIAVMDGALVQDTGRYALEVLGRVIRQANYVPHDNPVFAGFSRLDLSRFSPGIEGLDNRRPKNHAATLNDALTNEANHGSDVLAIRYFGSGVGNQPDGGMLNCAGFAVAAPARPVQIATAAAADKERDQSIFYVAADSTGEPELRCRYLTRGSGWHFVAIARGVEAFQVLYGIDSTINGPATHYLNATQMSDEQWRQVVTVRIALLVRGEQASGNTAPDMVYALFGAGYDNPLDPGASISKFKQPDRTRKLFQTTIQLRNPAP